MTIAAAFMGPLLVGIGLDALLHASPIGVLLGLALGMAAAAAVTIVQFRRYL